MRRGFTLVELLVVIVIIALLMALLLPAIVKALCTARAGVAEHMIDNLDQAAKSYEIDWAIYPPGDGTGTITLVQCLQKPGPKNLPYYEFLPDMLTLTGHIANPVHPNEGVPAGILYYRNNLPTPSPTAHRRKSFDMWCAGCNYPDQPETGLYEINNWE